MTRAFGDLVLASDPGLVRLRTALRATVGAAACALVLSRVPWSAGAGPPLLMGVWVAMITSFSVSDATPRAQRITLLLVPPVALAGTALGALLVRAPAAARVVMVALMFAAVAVRRYGPRGFTLGAMAFFPYFFALYFRASPALLPRIALGVLAGSAIAYAVRFRVLPERTRRVLPSAVRAMVARAANALLHLAEAARAPRVTTRRRRAIARELAALNRALLDFDAALARLDPACIGDAAEHHALRAALLDLELDVESTADAVTALLARGPLDAAWRGALVRALHGARAAIRRRDAAREDAAIPALGLRELDAALAALARWRAPPIARGEVGAGCPREVVLTVAPRAPASQRFEARGMHPTTRQAIQAALAGGLAILAGGALSSTRWYWAVLTAYIVFNRAATVGESLARAWERVFGTVLGVAAGLLVAEVVKDEPSVQIALVFTCIFVSLYLFRVSYAWFVLGFTLILAVLYRLLGRYSADVLVVRLEETVLGSVLGAAVAMLVLPARAPVRVRGKAVEAVESLERLLACASAGRPPGASTWLDAAREVDRNWQDLLALAEAERWHRKGARRLMAFVDAAGALAFSARLLARDLDRGAAPSDVAARAARLARDTDALRALTRG